MFLDLLAKTLPLVSLAFLATAMLSVGLELTVRQIIEPLRDKRLLASALVVNIILVPLAAVVITRVIPMDRALAMGMIVYALAAGTEGGPKFTQLAKGNTGFAIGLLAVLLTFTILLMPAALALVVPGAQVDRGQLLAKLFMAVAVPVGLGLFLRARYATLADRLSAVMHPTSMALLAVFVSQVIILNYSAMLALQAGVLLGCLLYFAFAFGAAYLLGGPRLDNRRTLAIMTFVRNVPIALTAALQVFPRDPGVVVMVTVMAIMSLVLGIAAVVAFRRASA